MEDVLIGTIQQFPYFRTPMGWLLCNGQLLDIKNHEALFSVIGFQFGGNGHDKFSIPDLRPKDEHNNPIHLNVGDMYNGKPYIPSFICINGIYPMFD